MKLKSTIVLRKIAGETILVPVGEDALRINGLITVNAVGGTALRAVKPRANNRRTGLSSD